MIKHSKFPSFFGGNVGGNLAFMPGGLYTTQLSPREPSHQTAPALSPKRSKGWVDCLAHKVLVMGNTEGTEKFFALPPGDMLPVGYSPLFQP